MCVRVDAQSDAIYLDLTPGKIESSEEVADGIVLDYDAQGRLVGIEILEASKKSHDATSLQTLASHLSRDISEPRMDTDKHGLSITQPINPCLSVSIRGQKGTTPNTLISLAVPP